MNRRSMIARLAATILPARFLAGSITAPLDPLVAVPGSGVTENSALPVSVDLQNRHDALIDLLRSNLYKGRAVALYPCGKAFYVNPHGVIPKKCGGTRAMAIERVDDGMVDCKATFIPRYIECESPACAAGVAPILINALHDADRSSVYAPYNTGGRTEENDKAAWAILNDALDD